MTETGAASPDRPRPFFARVYPGIARVAERKGGTEHRRELLAGLSGRVVEVGAGTGLNFGYYPDTVTEICAVEPEPRLRALAEQAARDAPVRVQVRPGTAEALPLEDESCDAAILSLVLCSLPDVDAALAEVRRVLRRPSTLRFYEHVRSATPTGAGFQRAADFLWPYVAGGCHLSRDSLGAIERAGFTVQSVRRFSFMGLPHVIGTAALPS